MVAFVRLVRASHFWSNCVSEMHALKYVLKNYGTLLQTMDERVPILSLPRLTSFESLLEVLARVCLLFPSQ